MARGAVAGAGAVIAASSANDVNLRCKLTALCHVVKSAFRSAPARSLNTAHADDRAAWLQLAGATTYYLARDGGAGAGARSGPPKHLCLTGVERLAAGAEWDNSTLIGGDVAAGAARLKAATSADLLIWGHTRLAKTLLRHGLVDLIDLSIHPMLAGRGGLFFRDGLEVPLRLVSAKCFSQIVKLTYQPQARP